MADMELLAAEPVALQAAQDVLADENEQVKAKSLRIFLHPSTTCPFSSRMRWRMASTFPSRALLFFCSKAFRGSGGKDRAVQ